MNATNDPLHDYLARLNIEGKRTVWIGNRVKINYVYKKIKKYVKNARTACEVGLGEGYLLRLLHNSGLNVVGIDISKYLVKKLRNKFDREGLNIELIHGDISKIKLEKDKFDLLFCLDVLEHIPDLEKAIKNIKKGLSNDGLLIGTLPLHESLYENMVMCPKCNYKFHRIGHYHSFNSIEEIKQLLGPEFEILEIGEVPILRKISDIIRHVMTKILRLGFRKRIASTVYFVAKLKKVNRNSQTC
jgi:SAM-dependent methyltransferase